MLTKKNRLQSTNKVNKHEPAWASARHTTVSPGTDRAHREPTDGSSRPSCRAGQVSLHGHSWRVVTLSSAACRSQTSRGPSRDTEFRLRLLPFPFRQGKCV